MNLPPASPEDLLRTCYGLDASLLGHAALEAEILRQSSRCGVSRADYAAQLARSPRDLQALVEAVVVHETWMVRDGGPFMLIAESAAEWRRERFRNPARLRVLCLACATGEEAWSVAMALAEAGLSPEEFSIEGVDVSGSALVSARAGVYPARAFRSPDAERWRDRWCEPAPGGYAVRDGLRQSVHFTQANLLDAQWQAAVQPAHLVFCRNVLIYFEAGARARMLAFLRRIIGEQGLLFTGHAEAVLCAAEFRTFGPMGAFAFSGEQRVSQTPPPSRVAPALPPRVQTQRPPSPPARPKANTAPGDDLTLATRLADQGRYAEALVCVNRVLEADRTNTQGWLLKGLSEQALGDAAAAGNSFSRTVYLDPVNEVALLALARLETLAGHPERAQRLRDRAARGAAAGVEG
jgi:chemotaxis protein methyltransferase WspC